MRTMLSLVLALALLAPACMCSLHAAPRASLSHSCCEGKEKSPAPAEKDGCGKDCKHCTAEYKAKQDQPKETQPVFSQVLLAVLPQAATADLIPDFVPFLSPIRMGIPAPSGRIPTYLLHCAILC